MNKYYFAKLLTLAFLAQSMSSYSAPEQELPWGIIGPLELNHVGLIEFVQIIDKELRGRDWYRGAQIDSDCVTSPPPNRVSYRGAAIDLVKLLALSGKEFGVSLEIQGGKLVVGRIKGYRRSIRSVIIPNVLNNELEGLKGDNGEVARWFRDRGVHIGPEDWLIVASGMVYGLLYESEWAIIESLLVLRERGHNVGQNLQD
jgi:hypothetical protein